MDKNDIRPTPGYEKMPLRTVQKLQALNVDLFEAEDDMLEDLSAYRRAKALEYWVGYQLDILDPNPDNKRFINRVCGLGYRFENDDGTFEPLCDLLRSVGYEMVSDWAEQKKIIDARKPFRKPRTKEEASVL